MNQINPEKYEIIVSVISKDYIDNHNFEEINSFYQQILDDPIKYENKIVLSIDGYDDDPRELYEIAEIRDYFSILDKLFPYWFYFLNKEVNSTSSSLRLIMLLSIPVKIIQASTEKKDIEFDVEKFIEFMNIHFHYLNELTDKLGLSLEENMRISNEVNENFK